MQQQSLREETAQKIDESCVNAIANEQIDEKELLDGMQDLCYRIGDGALKCSERHQTASVHALLDAYCPKEDIKLDTDDYKEEYLESIDRNDLTAFGQLNREHRLVLSAKMVNASLASQDF